MGVKCNYLHSEVSTLDRIKILRDLRRGEFDVLDWNQPAAGRSGPSGSVSLVAILDADKEGFLRFERIADSDHRARGRAQSGRARYPVCQRNDR